LSGLADLVESFDSLHLEIHDENAISIRRENVNASSTLTDQHGQVRTNDGGVLPEHGGSEPKSQLIPSDVGSERQLGTGKVE